MDVLFYYSSILIMLLPLALSASTIINFKKRIYFFLVFPIFQVLMSLLIKFNSTEIKSDYTLVKNYAIWLWHIALFGLILSLILILNKNINFLMKNIFKTIVLLVFFMVFTNIF